MRLTRVRVQMFECFLDSSEVEVEPDATSLVGKNESGKTAFLMALYRLNPAFESDFTPRIDYPRWMWRKDERAGIIRDSVPVCASFDLDDDEMAAVERVLGPNVLATRELRAWRTYRNELRCSVDIDEAIIVRNLIARIPSLSTLGASAAAASTVQGLDVIMETWVEINHPYTVPPGEDPINSIRRTTREILACQSPGEYAARLVRNRLPKFFYFSEYDYLPGRIPLGRLLRATSESLTPPERTARALLDLVTGDAVDLEAEDYEARVAELEDAASTITEQVLEYWTQNQDLRVIFDIDKQLESDSVTTLPRVAERYLEVRLRDDRLAFTTNFETRSSGFRWFFSFVVAFSQFAKGNGDVVVLLDEPGLALHPRAQQDFLRFIEKRLASGRQVLYTTHSPFMIDARNLAKTRLVEFRPGAGSLVSPAPISSDPDTLVPLKAALGYRLLRPHLESPGNLLVEGAVDQLYLVLLSRYLKRLSRAHLDLQWWTITPLGQADSVPTFLALMGMDLPNVTVLLSGVPAVPGRLNGQLQEGSLKQAAFEKFTGMEGSTIEDLFTVQDYLELLNTASETDLMPHVLDGQGPILTRIREHGGVGLDRMTPAEAAAADELRVLASLSEESLAAFEQLFEWINHGQQEARRDE